MSNIPETWTTPEGVRNLKGFGLPVLLTGRADFMAGQAITKDHAGQMVALLHALDALDPAVLAEGLRDHDILLWSVSVGRLRFCVEVWRSGTEHAFRSVHLGSTDGLNGRHVIAQLFELLEKLPDRPAPPALPKLRFIRDKALRLNVARDLDSLDPLLAQHEWKAATVLAGSVVEALLLNAVEDKLAKGRSSPSAYAARRGWRKPPEKWALEECLQAAQDLKLLTEDRDVNLVKACQGFRNLIHPGRERTTFPHDEGVAFGAVGAAKRLLAIFGT